LYGFSFINREFSEKFGLEIRGHDRSALNLTSRAGQVKAACREKNLLMDGNVFNSCVENCVENLPRARVARKKQAT
jgi:hypothetical protein